MAIQNDPIGPGETLATTAHKIENEAHRLAEQAKEKFDEVSHQAMDKFGDVRDQAMTLKDQALGQARSAAEEGKSKAAEALSGIAQAARDAAGQIGQNPSIAPVGKYGEQAADALERFASTLRNKEVDALLNDVAGMVRRNPAIAAGVAVAVGYALSRMLRSGDSNR